MYDSLFYRFELDAEHVSPVFHFLTSICPRFSAIVKKGPENPKTACFRRFSVVVIGNEFCMA